MKAVCVDKNRNLELREVPEPADPPPGYVIVNVVAAAINQGDKTFLKIPDAVGDTSSLRMHDIWGASASGIVVAAGADVPAHIIGRKVAVYRSLQRSKPIAGLWCEYALVPYLACLPLPEEVEAIDYSGSLVNVITAYSFLETIRKNGHAGLIATAGNSATGRALAALTREAKFPAIFLTRTESAAVELRDHGVECVMSSDAPRFSQDLAQIAEELSATAVFEGVGGAFASGLVSVLPAASTMYFYGFLSKDPISLPSAMFMFKDLTMKRFSNFDSETVREEEKLAEALLDLSGRIAEPLYRTTLGEKFALKDFEAAMNFVSSHGAKAIFVCE